MNAATAETSIEDIEARYKALTQRGDALDKGKNKIEAELNVRRRALKDAMEQAKKEGFNPDNLQEEIRRSKEVLVVKLDVYQAELDEAEKAMKPMLQEIQKG